MSPSRPVTLSFPFTPRPPLSVSAVAVVRCDRNLEGMASGFGITGKKGRCYDVWMDFSDCMSHCNMPAECTSRRDDYFECLHHRKEYSRMNAINKEKERQAFGDKNEKSHDSSGH